MCKQKQTEINITTRLQAQNVGLPNCKQELYYCQVAITNCTTIILQRLEIKTDTMLQLRIDHRYSKNLNLSKNLTPLLSYKQDKISKYN